MMKRVEVPGQLSHGYICFRSASCVILQWALLNALGVFNDPNSKM